jgi:uncharacterized protein (TIGR03067 family)
MIKRLPILFAALLLLGAEPSDAAKADLKKMQGEWTVEKAVRDGKAAPAEVLKQMKVTIADSKITIDDGSARDESAHMTLDPSKKPAEIDLALSTGGKPGLILGIYELESDTLTICWNKDGARPKTFVIDEDAKNILLVLKRKK